MDAPIPGADVGLDRPSGDLPRERASRLYKT